MAIHLEPPGITWNHLEKLGTTPGITWNNLALHLKPPGTTWHYISQKEHRKYTFCQWKEWNHLELIVTTTWHHMSQVIQVPHYPKVYCVLKNKNSQADRPCNSKTGPTFLFSCIYRMRSFWLVMMPCAREKQVFAYSEILSPREGTKRTSRHCKLSFSRSRYSQHQRKYTICCFLKCQYQIRWNANKHMKFIF